LIHDFPKQIKTAEERITGYERDLALYEQRGGGGDEKFAGMTVKGIHYAEKAEAGIAILEACNAMTSPEPQELGSYLGFPMFFSFDSFYKQYQITLRGNLSHMVVLGTDVHGNLMRINNTLEDISKKLEICRDQLNTLQQQMETAKEQISIPFEKEQELQTKSARLVELNSLLNMDQRENVILDTEMDEAAEPERKAVGYER
jgi:hypothetical protein